MLKCKNNKKLNLPKKPLLKFVLKNENNPEPLRLIKCSFYRLAVYAFLRIIFARFLLSNFFASVI